ncbi:MAG: hypothetical protein COV52_07965 [Gammaproteobacteria bacterium CG11_big_fil_rev_8_21_14_0_20_46_22]|nr:MAG: hypothetical protein COW05_04045 [Gammaproteobacteria bacterium CG12_big_fil_rev_8_21_14_0_65_46_12]PIR10690.1 MAG: hypothetical protein COV52_07965 [Gammaproteobacteria bacterium CG11_big_fil_rev_8_21_14_0_20_46_22]
MKEDLVHYLQQQIKSNDDRLKRFIHDISGKKYPQRFIYIKLFSYIGSFLEQTSNHKMVFIPGFRGVGKTTLMAQLCTAYQASSTCLFLSVEDAKNLLNADIADLIAAYEEIIGQALESIEKPLIIFLDEIQADPKWAVTLKSLFEKTRRVFFCCTGSSAVTLQTTANLARRAIFETMSPLSFTEYQMIKSGVFPTKGLKQKIRQAIYFSHNAEEAQSELLTLSGSINEYWSGVDRKDVRQFLSYGTFPFALTMPSEVSIYDSISSLLDKIIKFDLPDVGKFTVETLSIVKRILFVLAENDVTSLAKLEKVFQISRHTISSILEALEKAELLIKVPAYGSNMSAAKKPNKYLFMSPAIRMAFFYFTGQESTYLARQGKLLEDLVGSHLYREFILRGQGSMRYDSTQGGADFVLQILNRQQLIIEVGMGEKTTEQVVKSMKKINSDYNLVISSSSLHIAENAKTLFVPLDYFLLI